jgi:hypothetical protein
MCRPIRAAANPLLQICKRSKFCSESNAGAQALAFVLSKEQRCVKDNTMAKKPGTNPKNEFVFFDVIYEDGSQRSNRRVPAELLDGLNKDEPARGFIMEQDREIAEKSGRPPLTIKSIRRAGTKRAVAGR